MARFTLPGFKNGRRINEPALTVGSTFPKISRQLINDLVVQNPSGGWLKNPVARISPIEQPTAVAPLPGEGGELSYATSPEALGLNPDMVPIQQRAAIATAALNGDSRYTQQDAIDYWMELVQGMSYKDLLPIELQFARQVLGLDFDASEGSFESALQNYVPGQGGKATSGIPSALQRILDNPNIPQALKDRVTQRWEQWSSRRAQTGTTQQPSDADFFQAVGLGGLGKLPGFGAGRTGQFGVVREGGGGRAGAAEYERERAAMPESTSFRDWAGDVAKGIGTVTGGPLGVAAGIADLTGISDQFAEETGLKDLGERVGEALGFGGESETGGGGRDDSFSPTPSQREAMDADYHDYGREYGGTSNGDTGGGGYGGDSFGGDNMSEAGGYAESGGFGEADFARGGLVIPRFKRGGMVKKHESKKERFVMKSKPEFKSRYGDRWKEVLYATANKRFEHGGMVEHEGMEESGDGNDDMVNAQVSPGEFVIPADVVSALGDGNTEAGAEVLAKLIMETRQQYSKGLKNMPGPKNTSFDAQMFGQRMMKR